MSEQLRAAWCGGDMRPARPFVSDGVYSRFQVQLALMRGENRRNVMGDARILFTTIEAVRGRGAARRRARAPDGARRATRRSRGRRATPRSRRRSRGCRSIRTRRSGRWCAGRARRASRRASRSGSRARAAARRSRRARPSSAATAGRSCARESTTGCSRRSRSSRSGGRRRRARAGLEALRAADPGGGGRGARGPRVVPLLEVDRGGAGGQPGAAAQVRGARVPGGGRAVRVDPRRERRGGRRGRVVGCMVGGAGRVRSRGRPRPVVGALRGREPSTRRAQTMRADGAADGRAVEAVDDRARLPGVRGADVGERHDASATTAARSWRPETRRGCSRAWRRRGSPGQHAIQGGAPSTRFSRER